MSDMKRIVTRRPVLTVMVIVVLLAGVSGLVAAGRDGGRGRLGVSVERIPVPERQKLGVEFGVRVAEVVEDSAAAKAGIHEDDVIQFFSGKEIHSAEDLQEAVWKLDPGANVKIRLIRDKKPIELSAVLDKANRASRRFSFPGGHGWFFRSGVYLGVNLLQLTDDLAPYFGVKTDGGALVAGVEKKSPAAEAGIKGGDVITAVAGQAVHDPEDVREAIAEMEDGNEVVITVVRQKAEKSIKVMLTEREEMPQLDMLRMMRPGRMPQAMGDDFGPMRAPMFMEGPGFSGEGAGILFHGNPEGGRAASREKGSPRADTARPALEERFPPIDVI
jgi:membrane-associated protease RseP (regulator of RpoE activity)